MNKFFDDSKNSSTETAKWKATAEMMKERLDKLAAKVDGVVKRDDCSEAILKRVTVENIHLEAIREG